MVFESVGWGELSALLVLGLFVFGPERLPALVAQAGRWLREVKRSLASVTGELRAELGPELGSMDLRSLQPTDVARRLLHADDGDDGDEPTAPGAP